MISLLFADNDPDFLDTRSEFIEREGYHVIKAFSLEEAKRLLTEEWFPLAILDVRMRDDDDEKDVSGFILAKQETHRAVHKIILTNFPEHIHQAFNGISPGFNLLGKDAGPEVLIAAIEGAIVSLIRINWNLSIEWKIGNKFSLIEIIDNGLDGQHLLNRADELEDLFRRTFYDYDHIRIDTMLWQRGGRVALVVFAFREGAMQESFFMVCSQNNTITKEVARFREYSPKAPGMSATVISLEAETTHFASIAYTLAGNELDHVQTLVDLYHRGLEKSLKPFNNIISRNINIMASR